MGPGQELDLLVKKISYDELGTIIGWDIVETVSSLTLPRTAIEVLRDLALNSLYTIPEKLLGRQEVREIIYGAMVSAKLDELSDRLGLKSRDKLQAFDPVANRKEWQLFAGFFGIDTRGVTPFHIEFSNEDVSTDFGLFPHQRKTALRVWQKLESAHGRVVLHMPTGAGKTRTAIHIVSRFLNSVEPGLVVWLAATGELLEQAADAFKAAWPHLGNRQVSLVRFWGQYDGDLNASSDGIVIAGLQKFHAFSQRDPIGLLRFGSRVKLVVVDEAHQAIAPTYAALITKLVDAGSYHALLGLTATPGRTWADVAKDAQLSAFFDEKKVMLEVEGWDDPVAYLMTEGYLAKPTFNSLVYAPSPRLAATLKSRTDDEVELEDSAIHQLAVEANRNKIIIAEINRLVAARHTRIILFAASVRHAEIISSALFVMGIIAPVVTGTTATTLRYRIIRNFRSSSRDPMVLCNFGVLTTGFDAPNTSAAIIARPTRSLVLYSQMVGRATRGPKAGGNKTCEISTVVDIDLPGFGDVADAFTNWEDVWNE